MAEKTSVTGGVWETAKTIIYALAIAGLFRSLLFQPFWIPSGSMKETLLIGDFLFVNKMAYGYSHASCPPLRILGLDSNVVCPFLDGDNTRLWGAEPERGDVVVFRHPVHGKEYIKRLIGLPGDTVQMQDGRVVLNGKILPQRYDGEFREVMEQQGSQRRYPECENRPVGDGGLCKKTRNIETLPGGREYAVLNASDRGWADNTRVFKVPAGHYFFLGDNRDNSQDSRAPHNRQGPGFVPYENLIGRADRIMFSSSGRSMLFFWTWRSDRYFKAVQ